MALQPAVQCTEQRLDVERSLHELACQELILVREKQKHEQQYIQLDVQERIHEAQRELCLAKMESEQLKLDGLRQRKQNSILRLKLASTKEAADLLQQNAALLDQHSQRLARQVDGLKGALFTAQQQLTVVSSAKAVLQADAEKYQSEALQASMEVTRLREDLKLTTGRLNTATGQAADLLQQVKGVQAENVSLLGQLAASQGRDTEAAAAHSALQEALGAMKTELTSLRERVTAEEQARVAAEAAAAKSAAAAEAAADALAVKEQQMAAWRDLEQASKATASQQMQFSQAQLDSMHQRATATESKLLEQVATLQTLLDKERSARCTAEAGSTVAASKAAAERATLEQEVATLRQQVSQAEAQLSAAQAAVALEAKRAATIQQDLEHLQEQAAQAAAVAVEGLVEGLTQGQETEDDSEQPAAQQHPPRAAAPGAAREAAAAAGRHQKGQAGAVAATPTAQTAVFGTGIAAQLSGIDEGDEDAAEGLSEQEQQHKQPRKKQDHQQQQREADTAPQGVRPPRSAKSKAQAHIKAAAAADVTPPSSLAGDDAVQQDLARTARRVSPRGRAGTQDRNQDTQPNSRVTAAPASTLQQQGVPAQQQHQAQLLGHANADTATADGPPPLGFVPQSTVTPAAALKQPGVMKAAAERLSAASMLKKLNQGGVSHGGKPGARKRKIGPVTGNGSMDVLPSSLIMSSGFKPPKVRHLG